MVKVLIILILLNTKHFERVVIYYENEERAPGRTKIAD